MTEIERVEGFESGTIRCRRCSQPVTLYFNGGELDRRECCGLRYEQVITSIDLVISEIDE